tara:strand:+ start:246 stop:530 length:285 start_codon:yes stop_codon:yes gene_type:complete
MTVLATLVFTTFSSYLVNPQWFDHGSYSQYSTHSTLEECQLAKYGTDAICVGDSPSHLYVNDEAAVVEESKKEIEFVKCDYWAGCFTQGRQANQ